MKKILFFTLASIAVAHASQNCKPEASSCPCQLLEQVFSFKDHAFTPTPRVA